MDEQIESEEPFRGYKTITESGGRPIRLVGIHVIGCDELVEFKNRTLNFGIGKNTRFRNLNFVNCQVIVHDQCSFENCTFSDQTKLKCEIGREIDFINCTVKDSFVDDINSFQGGLYEDCETPVDGRVYDGTVFRNCVLGRGRNTCSNVEFLNARFTGGEFAYPKFDRCSFSTCSFWNVQFVSTTFFDACKFSSCKMSRWTWYTLPPQAGLTIANKLEINVSDPIENMRRNFTGINSILHWIFLSLFLAPYAIFIAWHWGLHLMFPGRGDEALLYQLIKYIVSGGETNRIWQLNVFSFGIFLIYIAYNACRAALLWKMLQIETEQRIKGVPGRMALVGSRGWKRVELVLGIAKWLMIPLVVFNTINFLLTKTPY